MYLELNQAMYLLNLQVLSMDAVQMVKHQPMDQNLKDVVKYLDNNAMFQKLKTTSVAVRARQSNGGLI